MDAKLIKKSENYYELYEVRTNLTLLIGSTDFERKIYVYGKDAHKLLSLKNCQAIELGYDLDELFNKVDSSIDYHEFDFTSFKHGANAILEILGDKKFSEEDMIKMWEAGANRVFIDTHPIPDYKATIKSLQQTEWDCVIFVDEKTKLPLLDNEGNLILKRR